tara:strand:- start:429 stop:674 length:246 start_codon:yes stop_codon:yes gene_type:complete
MIFNESTFKKLGFQNKKGAKNVLEASAEISSGEYITIRLAVFKENVSFLGIEVQGSNANEKRREYLKKYSLEEIHKLFSDY